MTVGGSTNAGAIYNSSIKYTSTIRPVISIKSCVLKQSVIGTYDNPYTIDEINSNCD